MTTPQCSLSNLYSDQGSVCIIQVTGQVSQLWTVWWPRKQDLERKLPKEEGLKCRVGENPSVLEGACSLDTGPGRHLLYPHAFPPSQSVPESCFPQSAAITALWRMCGLRSAGRLRLLWQSSFCKVNLCFYILLHRVFLLKFPRVNFLLFKKKIIIVLRTNFLLVVCSFWNLGIYQWGHSLALLPRWHLFYKRQIDL